MTAIIGVCYDGDVWLGADSAVTDGESDTQYTVTEPKVWEDGQIIIGASGLLSQLQQLRHCIKIPQILKTNSPEQYLAKRFIPELRDLFGDDAAIDILIGVRGRIFCVDQSFSYCDIGSEWAIGSGGQAARGALTQISKAIDPETRIRRALEASASICVSVDAPFIVVRK